MLDNKTKCWMCKRTEEEIIEFFKTNCRVDVIDICKLDDIDPRTATENTIIRLHDINGTGLVCPLCEVCRGIFWVEIVDLSREMIRDEMADNCPLQGIAAVEITMKNEEE